MPRHQPSDGNPRFDLAGPELALAMEYMPMVRTRNGQPYFSGEQLASLAAAHPGRTWLVGNEPDVAAQDWATPTEYAAAYHFVYQAVKGADPTATLVAGNIGTVTPLRLAYLDAVLAAYAASYGAPMPVDVWGAHTFILPETADGWGVGIPPGLPADHAPGADVTVDQHDDLALLAAQLPRMRTWMAANGYGDKPLWITEYGILMPSDYGFPPERVARFMTDSFDLFRTACDPDLGLAADGGRLVQRWLWFSAYASEYPTGDLFTAGRGRRALLAPCAVGARERTANQPVRHPPLPSRRSSPCPYETIRNLFLVRRER